MRLPRDHPQIVTLLLVPVKDRCFLVLHEEYPYRQISKQYCPSLLLCDYTVVVNKERSSGGYTSHGQSDTLGIVGQKTTYVPRHYADINE